ncbi:MAG: polysaccharide deacetylase family protein [Bacteroidales bacterium]|nr:polysaccharide deacetylase family protein [Bacteroidales bacterium]
MKNIKDLCLVINKLHLSLVVFLLVLPLSSQAAMVSFTFDDGSPTVYDVAYPILEKYGFKATFYVITDNIVYDYDNNVTRKQLLDLQTQGWEVGSHSVSHPHSTRLPFLYRDELVSDWEKVSGLLYTYRAKYKYQDHAWLYVDDVKNWYRRSSPEEVDQTHEGYFFDLNGGYLYLHLRDGQSPADHQIQAGSAERELKQSRNDLIDMGLNVKTFVSPYHDVNDSFIELVGQYYETIVGGKSGLTEYQSLPIEEGNVNPVWLVRSHSVKPETTLEQLKTMVDGVISADSWLIISLHVINDTGSFYSWSPAKLDALAAYISNLAVPVVTISQGQSLAMSDHYISLEVPTEANSITSYPPVSVPVLDVAPANCKPIGLGNNAAGKFNLHIGLPAFDGKVDVYLAFYSMAIDPSHFYLILNGPTFQIFDSTMIPWVVNTTGSISKQIFTEDIDLSDLPSGNYKFYLVVSPHGENLGTYYIWNTDMVVQ